MAKKKPLTKQQKRDVCHFYIVCFIFFVIVFVFNYITVSHYGMGPLFSPPRYARPTKCQANKKQLCTTKQGKCTKDIEKCVYPQIQEDCKFVMIEENLSEKSRQKLEKKYRKNETLLQEEIKKRECFCSSELMKLYDSLCTSLAPLLFPLEIMLTFALAYLLHPEIYQIAKVINI